MTIFLLTPMQKRYATKLLNQQLWAWGWDIRRPEGNLLIQYGFERRRPADTLSGSSYYRLALSEEQAVGLWGFGVLILDRRLGSVFLRRFSFNPRYCRHSVLPEDAHCPEDIEPAIAPHSDAVPLLTVRALSWFADYEAWVSDVTPPSYRTTVVEAWRAKRKPIVVDGPGMSVAWQALRSDLSVTSLHRNTYEPEGQTDVTSPIS